MDKLSLFIALTGVAVLLQAGVLLAMYIAMRKSSERIEAIANEVKTKVLPTVDQAQEMLTELRPKIAVIVDNVEGATTVVRSQVQRADATVNDVMDRARLQSHPRGRVAHPNTRSGGTNDRNRAEDSRVPGTPTFRIDAGDQCGFGVLLRRAWPQKWRWSRRTASRPPGRDVYLSHFHSRASSRFALSSR